MKLKVKFLNWSAGLPVAMINKKTAEHFGINPKDRVLIKTIGKNTKEMTTIVDTVEDLIKKREICISSELKEVLNIKSGKKVEVSLAPFSQSIDYITEKLNGKKLNKEKIEKIIGDITKNSLSEAEISMFISALYVFGMDLEEITNLIQAIIKTGKTISFDGDYIVDKHCIGGIPGNRTTPIVVSICSSAGLIFPKSSSRAITSAAGTADVIEAIAKVDFSIEEIKKIVQKTNACLIWGGGLGGVVPADSKIIRIEKILKIDAKPLLLSSVISKKLAVGSKYILIDIPYGPYAKVDKKSALELKKDFEKIGKKVGVKLEAVLTDGSQPIGNGIGPLLELNDIINILDPSKKGPKDLEEKSIFLAGKIFEMVGKSKKDEGHKLAREILKSGNAWKKFQEIINAQGGKIKEIKLAKYKIDLNAKKIGVIKEIHNKKINSLARITGCPIDKSSGVYLYHKVGESVNIEEKIISIYSNSKERIKQAIEYYNNENPFTIE